MSEVSQQNPDGSWSDAKEVEYADTLDWEVYGPVKPTKRYVAEVYRGVNPSILGTVSASNRIVLWLRMRSVTRRLSRVLGIPR